ncbi:hypothetical protein CcaverHIS002_0701890 [Cutaneotrichosporon cavernicola]|uniref:Ataxin-10 homolog n=1 Tax=Cutaneotrichosporon cavernicola TaxID=279322 RepID=A0AA48QYF4_9TREE|nr:uncharacterized protein CcaverHIS019_0701910 [Cutaneotrichosporon cavernicola]BEI86843.1 hypothetical protein CcaverHIS002_0701890 [Cutaneotrichosporon cavernicola]BEI94619.1 hypothetical protein CcaverHIS019_0701910 [Cutaneotrichosporon cavernicola]BEJ02396.1 hypothetical protein CcaverHIS631_0701910 [Cutaneotrichosporon cavernicola]BEJ10154.1 hypothetical protein CcaverHIS641_0701890 [Cutaneotrichosporon cavernicola]
MVDTDALRAALETATNDLGAERSVRSPAFARINDAARYVATHLHEREEIEAALPVWKLCAGLWPLLADALNPSVDNGPVELATALAKLERNMLAGSVSAQVDALPSEPDIRRLIFNVTTFGRIEDPEFAELQGVLSQLLCNLVSSRGGAESEALADSVLDTWLSGRREDDVLIRLLDSGDVRANTGVLRLLINLATPARQPRLVKPPALQWLARILNRLDSWHGDSEALFDLAVMLFATFFTSGHQADLYSALAVTEETVTPSQVTLLKLLDAYLTRPHVNPSPSPSLFVIQAWRDTAAYAAASMRSGKDDARLPSVLAALVLCTEILSTVVLAVQTRTDKKEAEGGEEAMVASMKGRSGPSIIPQLVDVLAATHAFLPRIKPTPTTAEENATAAVGQMSQREIEHAFANVKRDLVRLLAVLAYNDTAVGDDVRAAGGVQLVLGLCETDERNAYLREHALFAVRNLMTGNPANQAIIAKMEPLGLVGEDGVLGPLPDKLKKSDAAAKMAGRGE